MPNTRQRWLDLWRRVNAKGESISVYSRIAAKYSTEGRYYHNIDHIKYCLEELDNVRDIVVDKDEVEMAIFLHDVVYDTGAKDNEEKSAQFARELLTKMGIENYFIRRVCKHILSTKHDKPTDDADSQIIMDIDFSYLGFIPEAFDECRRNIRKEYGWVGEEEFNKHTALFFQQFLDRPSIYSTEHFRKKYENLARENLTRLIEKK
ncbi:MAG TPA: hypothetical protein VJH34_03355 [archaeon]|nr:hypothetical protein [archaeon]